MSTQPNQAKGPGPKEQEFILRYNDRNNNYNDTTTGDYYDTTTGAPKQKKSKPNNDKPYSDSAAAIAMREHYANKKRQKIKQEQEEIVALENRAREAKQKADDLHRHLQNIYNEERITKFETFAKYLSIHRKLNEEEVSPVAVGIDTPDEVFSSTQNNNNNSSPTNEGTPDEVFSSTQNNNNNNSPTNESAGDMLSLLMRPLIKEEQGIVYSAVHGSGSLAETLARQDAYLVQRSSMQRLQPGTWLNDELINYYLKICLTKRDEMLCAKQPGRKRSHFFSSFFVQTMFDEKNKDRKLQGKYNYNNVKRWGRKVPGKDIFNLKYIVVPINLGNLHWTSAVIFMEEKKIQYFDSMGGTDQAKLWGLFQYLKDEYKVKKGREMDTSGWKLVPCTEETPRQINGKCVTC